MYRFNALASVSSSSADSLVYTAHNFLGTRRGAGHECSGGGGGVVTCGMARTMEGAVKSIIRNRH